MSLGSYFQLARLALGLLPVIIEAVKAVEAAIPGQGRGEQKLALVRAALEAAFVRADDAAGTFEQLWPLLERLVSQTVATFNEIGVFRS